ncbi:MAG: hypothetical protein H7066_22390 [Cytophagaceae bacterium]|nr:hypothetical protein [Gemmatimonadaceae bacterium]
MATPSPDEQPAESVGSVAALYLGNILYALEATASGFDAEGKTEHAAFYRGIARKLAEARGREKGP